ncbi:GNAT family N-acetyltransferase [Tissierella sp. P1]|uniref:GNAT family N-acetyltransferase n=1 Tax=Tissierella TaxID=41273 RepID=UPI000BA0C143|nr:GNAT family N-acetyltransferase [Tissierella sp. P1]MDU5081563.1 GNAT family N-acetyltransferase [Bacillota bacterium]OZV13706.1 GNAT family N-acetyltransferase [Tissierella sp. P1]
MEFQIIKASKEYKNIVGNLMQFYFYDFSEFVKCDVEDNGLYRAYEYLDDYWNEENHRFPYLVKQDGKYIGFVLVRLIESEEENYFSIAEFFIMKKYRRKGIGQAVANKIFDLHRGQWEVFQIETNKPAQAFWHKTIDEYTKGQFKERSENGKKVQEFVN